MRPDNEALREIRGLEEKLLQPEERASAEDQLSLIIADCFVEFGSSGHVYDRRQTLEAVKQSPVSEFLLSDFDLKTLADGVVLATYRVTRRTPPGGPPVHSLRSSVWQFLDGRWQIVFHQGTATGSD